MHCEARNKTLWNLMAVVSMDTIPMTARRYNFCDVTLPVGTILEVDRIFIRKGSATYNSVTFKGNLGGHLIRFWVELKDANQIDCEAAYA